MKNKMVLNACNGLTLETTLLILEALQKDNHRSHAWSIRYITTQTLYQFGACTDHVHYISEEAFQEAEKNGVDFTILRGAWLQKKHDPNHGRINGLFHVEHVNSISGIRERLNQGFEPVVDILRDIETAWITKRENKVLNHRGFKSKRPEGWKAAYATCGIKIVTWDEYVNFKENKVPLIFK